MVCDTRTARRHAVTRLDWHKFASDLNFVVSLLPHGERKPADGDRSSDRNYCVQATVLQQNAKRKKSQAYRKETTLPSPCQEDIGLVCWSLGRLLFVASARNRT